MQQFLCANALTWTIFIFIQKRCEMQQFLCGKTALFCNNYFQFETTWDATISFCAKTARITTVIYVLKQRGMKQCIRTKTVLFATIFFGLKRSGRQQFLWEKQQQVGDNYFQFATVSD